MWLVTNAWTSVAVLARSRERCTVVVDGAGTSTWCRLLSVACCSTARSGVSDDNTLQRSQCTYKVEAPLGRHAACIRWYATSRLHASVSGADSTGLQCVIVGADARMQRVNAVYPRRRRPAWSLHYDRKIRPEWTCRRLIPKSTFMPSEWFWEKRS